MKQTVPEISIEHIRSLRPWRFHSIDRVDWDPHFPQRGRVRVAYRAHGEDRVELVADIPLWFGPCSDPWFRWDKEKGSIRKPRPDGKFRRINWDKSEPRPTETTKNHVAHELIPWKDARVRALRELAVAMAKHIANPKRRARSGGRK